MTALLGNQDAMTAKVTNDAVAFIRSLAELRHRNADWAERLCGRRRASRRWRHWTRVIDLVATSRGTPRPRRWT